MVHHIQRRESFLFIGCYALNEVCTENREIWLFENLSYFLLFNGFDEKVLDISGDILYQVLKKRPEIETTMKAFPKPTANWTDSWRFHSTYMLFVVLIE